MASGTARDLGPITAYEYAVENGFFTGTEAEWIEMLSNVTNYAQEAKDAAAEAKTDYTSLSGEVGDLQTAKAGAIKESASGDVAVIVPDATVPNLLDVTVAIKPVQSGSGDPSSENVRPISGWDAVNVWSSGKNLCPFVRNRTHSGVTFTTQADGSVVATGTATASATNYAPPFYLLPGTYVVSGAPADSAQGNKDIYVQRYLADGTTSVIARDYARGTAPREFTLTETTRVALNIRIAAGKVADGAVFYPMIRLAANTDPTYATYQEINKYDVDLGQTVYGGSLDVTTGELTVTHANIASYAGEEINEPWISSMDVYSPGAVPSNGAQVVYPLDTPITYQLTPTEVAAVGGQTCNVWADAGPVTVAYAADLKAYLDRLTSPDADLVADANIESGKYFVVGNTLYLSTASIAAGEAIVPGTNCTETNLAEALNALGQN